MRHCFCNLSAIRRKKIKEDTMKKLVALLLAVVLVLGLMTGALAADGELAGKTVILHTNDVHGAIGLYAP